MATGRLPAIPKLITAETELAEVIEILIANMVLMSEIPAPTFGEQQRVEFLRERLSEFDLQNISTDEMGNALGLLPGTRGERNIVVVAHMDTVFGPETDHTVTITPDHVIGSGVADNSLGAATVATLPLILERLGIRLRANLILMGSSRSLGSGDLEGIRFFLDNTDIPVTHGICLEGVKLGRLSYSSLGMVRSEIRFEIPDEYDWTRFGAGGAIVSMNDIINRVLEIPIPRRPRTAVVFNRFESGASSNLLPSTALLEMQIRSEAGDMVEQLDRRIGNIVAEAASDTGADVRYRVLSRRRPGGLAFAHPLPQAVRDVMQELEIQPRITPSTSELSAFIDHGIPAVTIGLTDGDNINEEGERILIRPITRGIRQLLGVILAMDSGLCDE